MDDKSMHDQLASALEHEKSSGPYNYNPRQYKEEKYDTLDGLKQKINNFLFEVAPPTMRVYELDMLANSWYNSIVGAWEHWEPKPLKK